MQRQISSLMVCVIKNGAFKFPQMGNALKQVYFKGIFFFFYFELNYFT